MRITYKQLRTVACDGYSDKQLRAITGAWTTARRAIERAREQGVPDEDIVHIACSVLPPDLRQRWVDGIIERAIRCAYADATPDWQSWADRWLSGEDRSAWSAARSAEAAWAASRAISTRRLRSSTRLRRSGMCSLGRGPPAAWTASATRWSDASACARASRGAAKSPSSTARAYASWAPWRAC